MDIQHELMEMCSLFLFQVRRMIKEVHQHGLPTAHTPVEIESLGTLNLFFIITAK